MLRREVVPHWGHLKAKDIARRDVVALLQEIVDRGAPIQSNRVLTCINRMFSWAVEVDMLEVTPCHRMKPLAKENRRDRVLTYEELRRFWTRLPECPVSLPMRQALRVQLLTAARIGEVLSMRWTDVDFDGGIWTIPAANSKNGEANRVPLSPAAVEAIRALEPLNGNAEYVFRGIRGGGPHIVVNSTSVAIGRAIPYLEVGHFTPHDLRRSAATYLAALGTPRLVLSKILNHTDRSVDAIYDRHGYDNEKRAALDAWARKLAEIVEGQDAGKVVDLRPSTASTK
jgi:integrase